MFEYLVQSAPTFMCMVCMIIGAVTGGLIVFVMALCSF